MKRYKQHTEVEYGTGYYDGERYEYHEMRESETGEWVNAKEAFVTVERMQKRINRMQKRIDKLEGRK